MLGLMWDAVKGILLSPTTKEVVGQIADLYLRRSETEDEAELAAIDAQVRMLELQAKTLSNEQRFWATAWIRPAFAFLMFLYAAKIVVWDVILGLGVTDNLSPLMEWVFTAVVGSYFVVRPFEKIFMR